MKLTPGEILASGVVVSLPAGLYELVAERADPYVLPYEQLCVIKDRWVSYHLLVQSRFSLHKEYLLESDLNYGLRYVGPPDDSPCSAYVTINNNTLLWNTEADVLWILNKGSVTLEWVTPGPAFSGSFYESIYHGVAIEAKWAERSTPLLLTVPASDNPELRIVAHFTGRL